jgi:hypothetical protein
MNLTNNLNAKQIRAINRLNAKIDSEKIAEKICARDDIGDECVCSECINNLTMGYGI